MPSAFRGMPRNVLRRIAQETVEYFEAEVSSASPVGQALQAAKQGTTLYSPESQPAIRTPSDPVSSSVYEVTRERTCSAVLRLVNEGFEDPLALVFSSARKPGGGFLNGAAAQEESVCRCSGLYMCLKGNPMYAINERNHRGGNTSCMYTSHMIYSPKVPVIRDSDNQTEILAEPISASFITAPAPNAGVARRRGADEEAVRNAMRERIRLMLAIAQHYGHSTLVLGAFGCGVFKNQPGMVAAVFHEELEGDFKGLFAKVVFAVLDDEGGVNYGAFRNEFGGEEGG
ncbi:hypothetical protein BSKO_12379 [Bryopsis sp. KO-2023]|nr:hypothetical protein BSKO_12379 [Bryopsis sp. KO-2023]